MQPSSTAHYLESRLSGLRLHTRAHGATRGDVGDLGIEMSSVNGSSEYIVKVAVHSSRGAASSFITASISIGQYYTTPPSVVKLNFLGPLVLTTAGLLAVAANCIVPSSANADAGSSLFRSTGPALPI